MKIYIHVLEPVLKVRHPVPPWRDQGLEYSSTYTISLTLDAESSYST